MAKPKKKSTNNESLSAEEFLLPKAEKINVDHLIAQSLLRHKNDIIADKKIKHKEIRHLSTMAEEYLSCFMLVGYSIQGEQVVVMSMPTPKDEAALVDLLRSTLFDILNNRP